MPRCNICRINKPEHGHDCCYDCGAELYEQWRDEVACAAAEASHEAAMALARTGEFEVEFELADPPF